MLRTGLAVIALSLGGAAGAASAQPALDSVLSALARQGFGAFEIKREDGQVKVEALRGATERELVWDATTGQLLKDETGRRDDRVSRRDDDGPRAGRGDDRRGGRGADDDDDNDDRGSRSGRGGGDRDDDHGGRGGGRDDHGGRSGSGGGSDDRGGRSGGSGGSGRGGHDDGPGDDHD